jgi:hypothetical protein
MTDELLSALTHAWVATLVAMVLLSTALVVGEDWDTTAFLRGLQDALVATPV